MGKINALKNNHDPKPDKKIKNGNQRIFFTHIAI